MTARPDIGPDSGPRAGGPSTAVEVSWIPLGAGGHFVRFNGRVFEAVQARREHRPRCDIYHAALHITTAAGRFVIELAPAQAPPGSARGVVAEGPVGMRWAGRLRWFRYEVRCWEGGTIPDIAEAVESPLLVSTDERTAQHILDEARLVPTLVWGRDDMRAGEMWNSNSVVSWLLVRSGIDATKLRLPAGGRAPGWHAGIVVARRESDPAGLIRTQPKAGPVGYTVP